MEGDGGWRLNDEVQCSDSRRGLEIYACVFERR